jgi:sugar lactone lactonase YvrE
MKTHLTFICALLWATTALCQPYEVYVSDAPNFGLPPWQVLKYDENGENPAVFTTENLSWPHDIVFLEDTNRVLISNYNSGTIDRYDATTGRFIDVFSANVVGPTRMKIDPDDGLLYVLQDGGTNRVRRFELDGTFVDDFTNQGLARSLGMAWDSQGNFYVSSYQGRLVRIFDPDGLDQGNFVSTNLTGPTNIWFNEDGDLLVADYDGGAIRRFDSEGVYQGDFIQGLSQVEGVDFLPDGDILLGNAGTDSVKRFTPGGVYVDDFIGSQVGGLTQPTAVVVRTVPSDFLINAGLNDAWFNPATVGQGFLISVFPDIEQVFLAWFTYDVERPPADVTAILGEPGHRWLTAQGPYEENTADLTIFLTRDGVFDSADPPATTDPAGDGTIKLEFADCEKGFVDYSITSLGLAGKIPIERIANDNVPLCETLNAAEVVGEAADG